MNLTKKELLDCLLPSEFSDGKGLLTCKISEELNFFKDMKWVTYNFDKEILEKKLSHTLFFRLLWFLPESISWCYNRIPETGWLMKNRGLFCLEVLETGESKSTVPGRKSHAASSHSGEWAGFGPRLRRESSRAACFTAAPSAWPAWEAGEGAHSRRSFLCSGGLCPRPKCPGHLHTMAGSTDPPHKPSPGLTMFTRSTFPALPCVHSLHHRGAFHLPQWSATPCGTYI